MDEGRFRGRELLELEGTRSFGGRPGSREIDPTPQRKYDLEQLLQKLALQVPT